MLALASENYLKLSFCVQSYVNCFDSVPVQLCVQCTFLHHDGHIRNCMCTNMNNTQVMHPTPTHAVHTYIPIHPIQHTHVDRCMLPHMYIYTMNPQVYKPTGAAFRRGIVPLDH